MSLLVNLKRIKRFGKKRLNFMMKN